MSVLNQLSPPRGLGGRRNHSRAVASGSFRAGDHSGFVSCPLLIRETVGLSLSLLTTIAVPGHGEAMA